MRHLLLIGWFWLVCVPTSAQIVGLEIHGSTAKKKYNKWMADIKGLHLLCGEVVSGLEIDPATGGISRPSGAAKVVLLVPDLARPELEIYAIDKSGQKKIKAKNQVLSVSINDFTSDGMHLVYPLQNLHGLRSEYLLKAEKLDRAKASLKSEPKGSAEWFAAFRKLRVETETLLGWLQGTLFESAAKKMSEESRKQLDLQGAEASQSRLDAALGSAKETPPPLALQEASEAFGHPQLGWQGYESRHARFFGTASMNPNQLVKCATLAERIIERFRSELVDPFLGPGDKDPMLETQFIEFIFPPNDPHLAARFLEEYYKKPIGEPRDRAIEIRGHRKRQALSADYLQLWRFGKDQDLEGVVAHTLGHVLANIVFNGNSTDLLPPWLAEGFSYWVSFESLSRSSVTSHAFSQPKYDRKAQKEGVKPTGKGLREAFNLLAIQQGPSLGDLFMMDLVTMQSGDLAKSWSVVDWLVTAHRPKLRELLSKICLRDDLMGKVNTEVLRPDLERIFGITGRDVFKELDDAWREHAMGGDAESPPKKR